MAVRNRAGFTLVELLVVVVIIAMLVALLVPAVLRAREAARRAKCISNQAQLAKAVQQYDTAKQHFPGYVNMFGTLSTEMSWIVVCLPYMDREDLWRKWREEDIADAYVRLDELVCPSEPPSDLYPTSYVANCGRPDPDPSPATAYGVFYDHFHPARQDWVFVSGSSIPDGAQSTLLFGENVQAGEWYETAETSIGMVWQQSPGACGRVNRCLDDTPVQPIPPAYARPSSHHGGGAVVTYCDGHVDFLNEDVSYNVYQRMMAANDSETDLP